MGAPVGQNREIEQLKTLLFQPEASRLQELETNVARLQQYVGTADRLEAATADVLVTALERAEVSRPRELANAVAPLVISAIRSEIRNSRDLMVDALYPITGRLVSAAVANAFKELVAFLEQRISALTSAELWIGRIKSLVTGRPISEFVLADSNPPRVKRLLLLERGNGRLIAAWKRDESPDERTDLLSAMVAAILEFSLQALAGEGNLQTLDFGGREIVLRASPQFVLAAECIGPLRPADNAKINSLFFDTIERIDSGANCDAAMLASLAASIESGHFSRKKSRRGRVVLFILLALCAAVLVWLGGIWVTRSMLERRTNAALEQLVDEQPLLASFPLRLDFDHRNRSFSVSGIAPSQLDVSPLTDTLAKAAAPYRLVNRIGVVPGLEQSAALHSSVATAQQSLARAQARIDETLVTIAAESKSRNEEYAKLREQYARLSEQYAKLQSVVDGPALRLQGFIASTAIFFGNEDEFLDSGQAEQQLRDLAELLANNDLRIRIVGYADESGSDATNRTLGRKRAEQVMRRLTSLGVEPSRLFIVSRSSSMPITDRVGAAIGGNRRVTFENAFRAEVRR
ncbi:OmpA family protein [Bradyrhizobium cenepequi]|uniref:OmpA family protein n=1 Tax=Bradyrhizobium cenepequi TaxID=2821403 RepID=UPI001CE260F1|nr:OmpA family protein [Bradyrhizobium cenepequi]MCA6109791.1 OmpA family protein [Bradyrhizobium cenepequi]